MSKGDALESRSPESGVSRKVRVPNKLCENGGDLTVKTFVNNVGSAKGCWFDIQQISLSVGAADSRVKSFWAVQPKPLSERGISKD